MHVLVTQAKTIESHRQWKSDGLLSGNVGAGMHDVLGAQFHANDVRAPLPASGLPTRELHRQAAVRGERVVGVRRAQAAGRRVPGQGGSSGSTL